MVKKALSPPQRDNRPEKKQGWHKHAGQLFRLGQQQHCSFCDWERDLERAPHIAFDIHTMQLHQIQGRIYLDLGHVCVLQNLESAAQILTGETGMSSQVIPTFQGLVGMMEGITRGLSRWMGDSRENEQHFFSWPEVFILASKSRTCSTTSLPPCGGKSTF